MIETSGTAESVRESASDSARRIRGLRAPKPAVDPWRAHGSVIEDERLPDGTTERALTVFLAGAECPFTCSFCDLWRWTIDEPTPPGALPAQLSRVIDELAPTGALPRRIKLYNASNFFDPRAVPREDIPEIARLCAAFAGVTVESHANTVDVRALDFARRIRGRLEVAIGLETIHPDAMRHLNKRLDLDRFDAAADYLAAHGIDLRVFVLVGAPHVPAAESVEWAVRTARYAAERGARMIALIPVRSGNGELERLAALGHFTAPTLAHLERALDACADIKTSVVTADLWDVERLSGCSQCRDARIERMRRINVAGGAASPVMCAGCE